MGWFDDESDSDDQGAKPKALLLHEITTETQQQEALLSDDAAAPVANQNPDSTAIHTEEDDPLDAYMKGLVSEETQQSATPANRLDWHEDQDEEDDDEANESTLLTNETTTKDDSNANPEPFDLPGISKIFYTPTSTSQGRDWRAQHDVKCSLEIDPMLSFDLLTPLVPLGLVSYLSQTYPQFTCIQSQALPVLLSGHDALMTAQTGQGKTLAYLLPALVHCYNRLQNDSHNATQRHEQTALVLVPTRELAIQVHAQALPLLKLLGMAGKVVIGGSAGSGNPATAKATSKYQIQRDLQTNSYALIIATPARLIDVLRGFKTDLLGNISFCVLDEADKMLSMGFSNQVDAIWQRLPRNRQTVLISATMGRKMDSVIHKWLAYSHVRVAVGRTGQASQTVEQHVMVLPNDAAKEEFLVSMLDSFVAIGRTLVFCKTREGCEALASVVASRLPRLDLVTLHGDKHQMDRNAALKAFAKQSVNLMIATDVAGRGLDVPDIMTVVSFDAAKTLDAHVHRCGRAGRLQTHQQQVGAAYTLLTKRDVSFARVLRNAFEREGRTISPELAQLAGLSGGMSLPHRTMNQAGLGFGPNYSSDTTAPPSSKRSRFK